MDCDASSRPYIRSPSNSWKASQISLYDSGTIFRNQLVTMAPLKRNLLLNSSFPAIKPLPGKKKNFPEVTARVNSQPMVCRKPIILQELKSVWTGCSLQ